MNSAIWLLVVVLRGTGMGDQNMVIEQFPTEKACQQAVKIIGKGKCHRIDP